MNLYRMILSLYNYSEKAIKESAMFGRSIRIPHPLRILRFHPGGWIILMALTLICIGCGSRANPEITADTDRDGKIDFQKDRPGKNSWIPERGALFFNNNDSDMDTHYPDHEDDVVNGADDLKDLAALPIDKISP
jgi:hypothetical protein